LVQHDRLFIDGEWVTPLGRDMIDDINPATEEVIAQVPSGAADDVDRAVNAASAAFESWSQTRLTDRQRLLRALVERLQARQEELALLIAREVGTPMAKSLTYQVRSPIAVAESIADLLVEIPFEETVGPSRIWREPIGVVGCITPWNFPLHQAVAKVVPAIAAGCTVVLKPSELAPLTGFALAEIFDEIGLPPGVFNLVTGTGEVAGESLVSHPDVQMISFTGSTTAGRHVAARAAANVKRVSQELGGKAANLILDDADLRKAVRTGVGSCLLNSGQTCFAWTRMLVPRQLHDQAVELATRLVRGFDLGDPVAGRAKLGPLISDGQRARVRGFIEEGIAEGAQLMTGGAEPPPELNRGFYVQPTLFAHVQPEMRIAREENFGPVLAILSYDDEDHAVEIANGTIYGLAAAVWSADEARALRVAQRLRCGQVDINGAHFNPAAPFGGYRQSGNGRELGRYGLEEFLELKAVHL
jgi:betaine-aldehyde dehydrogenase